MVAYFSKKMQKKNTRKERKTEFVVLQNWKCVPLNKQFKAVNVNTINVTSHRRARWGNTFIFYGCWVQIDRRGALNKARFASTLATAMFFKNDMVKTVRKKLFKVVHDSSNCLHTISNGCAEFAIIYCCTDSWELILVVLLCNVVVLLHFAGVVVVVVGDFRFSLILYFIAKVMGKNARPKNHMKTLHSWLSIFFFSFVGPLSLILFFLCLCSFHSFTSKNTWQLGNIC